MTDIVSMGKMTTIWESKTHETVIRLNQGGKSCKALKQLSQRAGLSDVRTYLAV